MSARRITIEDDGVGLRYEAVPGLPAGSHQWTLSIDHDGGWLLVPQPPEHLATSGDVLDTVARTLYNVGVRAALGDDVALAGHLERNGYHRLDGYDDVWRAPDGHSCSAFAAVQELVVSLGGKP